jgi:hypothetical protein
VLLVVIIKMLVTELVLYAILTVKNAWDLLINHVLNVLLVCIYNQMEVVKKIVQL